MNFILYTPRHRYVFALSAHCLRTVCAMPLHCHRNVFAWLSQCLCVVLACFTCRSCIIFTSFTYRFSHCFYVVFVFWCLPFVFMCFTLSSCKCIYAWLLDRRPARRPARTYTRTHASMHILSPQLVVDKIKIKVGFVSIGHAEIHFGYILGENCW